MRQLHPVGQRERFVRRGVYRRLADDLIVERWTLHTLDGAYLARVDQDNPTGGFRLYEALFDAEGLPVRFNQEVFRTGSPRTRIHRVFVDGVMQTTVGRGEQAEAEEHTLPASAIPTDWPWIVQGLALYAAVRLGWHAVFDVAVGDVWPVEVVTTHDGVQVMRVAGRRLWIDAQGVALAAEDGAHNRVYLDDGSSKSKAYASVE
ncbi:hypothetical protein CEN41_01775 [Fischerella thermalis CCMEE 5330]|uniref:Uncharacterized protein n=1 Tax=Fischerella thermalis CCMEE 5330 TaxID=2019670 RepID=A0A2N6MNF4_9CYAN|nr:hypothetical protein CEN41_01775 [Fischerella thermalis CCMEE 5330]